MDDYLSFKSKTQEAAVRVHQSENIYPHLQRQVFQLVTFTANQRKTDSGWNFDAASHQSGLWQNNGLADQIVTAQSRTPNKSGTWNTSEDAFVAQTSPVQLTGSADSGLCVLFTYLSSSRSHRNVSPQDLLGDTTAFSLPKSIYFHLVQ